MAENRRRPVHLHPGRDGKYLIWASGDGTTCGWCSSDGAFRGDPRKWANLPVAEFPERKR